MDDQIHHAASDVYAEKGVVSVEGPDGVSILMDPEAAEETSHRMLDAAATAQGQRVREEGRKRGDDRPT